MKRLLFLLLLGALGAWLVRTYFIEGIYIASASMEPTLPKGAHYFVNKFSLRFRHPFRGEVVVFKTPQGPDKDLVKRVIAIEKDVIALQRKRVTLNYQPLSEPYVQYLRPDILLEGDDMDAIEIPPGYVFVMGDNRDFSRDSRDWMAEDGKTRSPYVPVSAIKGILMGVE